MNSWFGLLILWCLVFAFYLIYLIMVHGKKIIIPKDVKLVKKIIKNKNGCVDMIKLKCNGCPLLEYCENETNEYQIKNIAKAYIKERGYE